MAQAAQPTLEIVEVSDQFKEVSGLTPVSSARVLEAHGWALGFWAVLDEPPVEHAVLMVGRRADATGGRDGWEVAMAGPFDPPRAGTADGESVARHGGFVYVFGSHFGSKDAGLETDRAFTARFREDKVLAPDDDTVGLEVRKDRFRLHRAINDALVSERVALLPIRREASELFIDATRRRAEAAGKEWAGRIHAGDWPLNIEGAAFRANGNLLLGLRSPVSEDGHPIIVELGGFVSTFGNAQQTPRVQAVCVLNDIGSSEQPLGVRDLEAESDDEHLSVIVGRLDRELLRKRDRDSTTPFAHWRTTMTGSQTRARWPSELIRVFGEDVERLEGVAQRPDGRFVYATDEGRVVLRYVREAEPATDDLPV